MSAKFFVRSFLSFFLIVSISLMNVSTVLAEGPTPPPVTEEPTQEPTAEAPSQSELAATEVPTVEETSSTSDPAPAVEEASTSGPFAQIPENTDIVVLDENGNPLPLVSSESLNVILEEDPKWCPEGELPTSGNCTANLTITQLLDLMELNDGGKFNTNGVIYFERGSNFSYTSSFILDDSTESLGASYATIKNFNITLRGGWAGGNSGTLDSTDPTVIDNNANVVVRVGSSLNPWIGNVTIRDITVRDNDGTINGNPVTINGPGVSVYTTTGDVALNNVDVVNQQDGQPTALINSSSGDISVTNGSSFDGTNNNNLASQGFVATTNTGSINITGTNGNPITFTDSQGNGDGTNYNGATLSAPTVSLSYVTATGSDKNGIYITNANTVTLNQVTTSGNGTNPQGANNSVGSGVYIQAPTNGTIVTVTGGSFTNNERYGIELTKGTLTFNNPQPNFGNNNGYGTYLVNTAPVLTLPANITREATGPNGAVVTYTATAPDAQDNPDPTPVCTPTSGNTFGITTTTVNCTATDSHGVSTSGSFTITVRDTTRPTIAAHGPVTAEATSPAGALVTYTSPATSDIVDGAGTATCAPASGSTFSLGNTTVTCNATDAHGNAALQTTFTVSVVDTTAPSLSLPGNMTVGATSTSGAIVTYSASALDLVDTSVTFNCVPPSGTNFSFGTTTVNCSATDDYNNSVNGSFTVTVQDATGPVLTLPANIVMEATGPTGAIVTYSASAVDAVDGDRPVNCLPASGSTFPLGKITVNCSSTDAHSNTSNGSFTVTVQDTTRPTINAHGDVNAEATSAAGAIVNYTNPTTSDVVDGSGTATCTPASGTTFALGNTTITCNITDTYGNVAIPTNFIVSVVDTTAPIIAAQGNAAAQATSSAGAVVTYTSPSTSDAVDGAGTAICVPASGSTFALGTTTVTCNATDAHSNAALPTTFTVTVVDTNAPVIAAHAPVIAEATSAAGAIVSYINPSTSDAVDGPGTATCAPASGSAFALGTTTVTCNASDFHGNPALPTTFAVIVQDTTPPVIAPHSDVNSSSQNISYTLPATSDAVDGAGIASCNPGPGGIFKVGDTLVTCTATDSHGNVATPISFMVHVSSQQTGPVTTSGLIPVTGDETINLDCNTKVVINGVKVIFHNLCSQKATLNSVDANHLPGKLPAGFTFVNGLDVAVLGQNVLPANTGIEMDFPTGNSGQFAVLYWNNGQWVEITQSLNEADLAKALGKDAANELYKVISSESGVSKALTTKNTGIFILVKK